MNRIILAAIASSAALAACAPMEDDARMAETTAGLSLAEEGADCFFPRSVSGYREAPDSPDGNEQIFVDAAGDTFLFETFGSCPALDFTLGLGLDTDGIGTICRGIDVDLIVPDSALGPQRCPVTMVRKVIEDENNY